MSSVHSTPWHEQLVRAIADFPGWGRLRPNSARGHAVIALAFHDWSRGGLGVYACASEVKHIGEHLYACTFMADGFKPMFVDWKNGWCRSEQRSMDRFQEDAGRGKTVYAYTVGVVDDEDIEHARMCMTQEDKVCTAGFAVHLGHALGDFSWDSWRDSAPLSDMTWHAPNAMVLVEPVALNNGRYVLPTSNPFLQNHAWPPGLSGDQLCSYLGAPVFNTPNIDFFAFQERMDGYLTDNPQCHWDAGHSTRLLTLLARESPRRQTFGRFFYTTMVDEEWAAPATRVVAPRFSPYLASLVELMQQDGKEQLDAVWLVASHGEANAQMFDMFETVFQGRAVLTGDERLHLNGVGFRLSGARGQRATLRALEALSSCGEGELLDALRQCRAWAGGILSVDAKVIQQDNAFWKERFDRREVAALLDKDAQPVQAHYHFHYEKSPLHIEHEVFTAAGQLLTEYSLFQQDAQQWRRRHGSLTDCAWGWKKCLDVHSSLPGSAVPFPACDQGRYFDSLSQWGDLRRLWRFTMGPGDAAAVYATIGPHTGWPVQSHEYEELAHHYLSKEPTLFAMCELMAFEPEGVLMTLREFSKNRALSLSGCELETPIDMATLLGDCA